MVMALIQGDGHPQSKLYQSRHPSAITPHRNPAWARGFPPPARKGIQIGQTGWSRKHPTLVPGQIPTNPSKFCSEPSRGWSKLGREQPKWGIVGNEASTNLKNRLDLRLPVLRWPGHDPQVLRHLDLAAAVGVAAEDEDLAFRVRLRRVQQTSPTALQEKNGR